MFSRFPHFRQLDEMDCGPTCLKIVCAHYGKIYSSEFLRSLASTTRQGSNLLSICEAAEKLGLKATGAKVTFANLSNFASHPFIAFWKKKHFVVVYRMSGSRIQVSDPELGLIDYTKEEFIRGWAVENSTGIIAALSPTEKFGHISEVRKKSQGFKVVVGYIRNQKRIIFQILLGLASASLLQLALPFLTQSIVDTGIREKNYSFIYLILLIQLFIFIGRTFLEIVRSHLLLYVSTRVNISLLTDFFIKLMNLPISYYDRKMTGDIMQRINDHTKVETFITSGFLNVIFSVINLVIFTTVLAFYSFHILLAFAIGSLVYFLWIRSFSSRRATLDAKRFKTLVATNEKNIELLNGMQEIKLGNAEDKKREEWEIIQLEQSKLNFKALSLKQLQIDVAAVINEIKNVVITFIAAKLVIQGDISLGIMLSIAFIMGQLNAPVLLITQFLQDYQDSKLSLERINEIHELKDEEQSSSRNNPSCIEANTNDIAVHSISFKYSTAPNGVYVLKDITIEIPENKITAIVGASGSGKTTLIKLLLKFYAQNKGKILVGGRNLADIGHQNWRSKCGVVMQEGYIFNDTIASNIALGKSQIDVTLLEEASKIANIYEFVMQLPLKFQTKIGSSGLGLSTGQKQRILIARAVYKQPEFLFFDEATSALDANNEKEIMTNLNRFFRGRTVVIVAHRLSTVFNADQIIVLQNGEIIERGPHHRLVSERGTYFNLIKNQLELGQ